MSKDVCLPAPTKREDRPPPGAAALAFASIAAMVWWLLVLPGRKVEADGSGEIESRVPGFEGRVRTWVEMRGTKNPVEELLAEDSLKLAAGNDPERAVPKKEFSLACIV